MNPDRSRINRTLSNFGSVHGKRHPEQILAPEYQRYTPKRFKIIVDQTQTGYTPTSTDGNKPETETERFSRECQSNRKINATRKKTKTRIPITFKGNVPEVDAVLITKDNKYKEIFQSL